jgi:predicted nucleic acid-binding protein
MSFAKVAFLMILVDSSVWIGLLRNSQIDPVNRLREFINDEDELLVGDLILCEVLLGARDDADARRIESALSEFPMTSLCAPDLAIAAAANYRFLRIRGITVRKTIDLIIGTFCIERGHALLHSDRDFEPMERLLGLRAA